MALSDLLPGAPSFISGPSPQQAAQLALSPASVERRRRVAEAMMKQGMDYSPVQSPWQGVARVTNAIMGGLDERKADDIERAGLASDRANMASLYGGLLGNGDSAGVPITGAAPAGGVTGAVPTAPIAPAAATEGHGGASRDPAVMADIRRGAIDAGKQLGVDPADLLTTVSYETGGTFDPWKAGPTTQWGQHRGLIQWGEPQRAKYGVTDKTPAYDQMLAAGQYLKDAGVKPGMGLMDIYSAVNAGGVGRYGASDAGNGGAPGTVADKVHNQMAAHRAKAMALLGMDAPQTTGAVPAPVQVASADPGFVPQAGAAVAPPGLGPMAAHNPLAPMDPATAEQVKGITDAPVAINPPPAGASGPLSPAAANPLNPGAITDAPLPPGVLPPAGGAPMTPNGLPSATNLGLRNQGIDPNQFMPQGSPDATGSIPLPPVDPRTAMAGQQGAPQPPMPAPAPQDPRAAMVAALQGPPKDSQIQMMIARGINPANPQAPASPARQSILAALSGAAPAPSPAAQSPAAAQVTGALAAPATIPAAGQQPPPYPQAQVPQQGNPAQLQAAIAAMSNPWASEGTRGAAKMIIDRELQSRDPLRRMQMLKLQQEMQGGTPDEIKQRQLAIQKTEQEINGPLVVGNTALDRKTMKPLWQPPEKPTTVSPGDTAIDNSGKVLFQGAGYKPQEVSEMRKEIQQLPSYKQYTAALPSWQSMVDAAKRPTGASDLNLVYGIAKIMDPTSVVREGEIQMANDTQGVAGRLTGLYQSLLGGNKLQADVRQALLAEAQSRMNGFKTSMDADMKGYGTVIKHRGMNPEDVLPNLPELTPWAPEPIATEAPPASTVLPGPAAPMPPPPVVPVPQGAPPVPLKGDMVPQQEAAPAVPQPIAHPGAALPGAVKGEDGTYYLKNTDPASAQPFIPILDDPTLVTRLKPGTVFVTPDGRRKVAH